jgi:VanZ family protein
MEIIASLDVYGTSPNFFVCAGAPFIAFRSKDAVSLASYAKTALSAAFGLSLYEVAQIYLPRRTFDPYDIVASFVGALFSIALARLLFFRKRDDEETATS